MLDLSRSKLVDQLAPVLDVDRHLHGRVENRRISPICAVEKRSVVKAIERIYPAPGEKSFIVLRWL
jgi:hypothetical protein